MLEYRYISLLIRALLLVRSMPMTKNKYLKIKLIISLVLILLNIFSSFYPLEVNTTEANSSVKKQDLVLVIDYSKDFAIDMKYATYDNFVKKAMYPSPTCVLTKGTLDKLIKANSIVKKQGFTIKIWDAYRPLSVQKIMWEATPNKNYVANPYRSGSKHNRGAAVDVTLIDKNGKELVMPTEFDNFTAKASPTYKGMSQEQRKNLNILSNAMTSAGFKTISHEWWHFEDTDWNSYEIQDLPLSKFDRTNYTLSNEAIVNLKSIQNSNKTSQLIVVTSQISNTSNVVISTYEKNNNLWVNVHKGLAGCIGIKGFTNNKVEGDNKTPAGAYKIGMCYSKTAAVHTGLDLYTYDSKDVWVDDTNSKYYNTHQREPANKRWSNAINFSKIKNGVYDTFITIAYNDLQTKNKGSAIFLHIENSSAQLKYTYGGVATSKENLLSIAKWLDKGKEPIILLGSLNELLNY